VNSVEKKAKALIDPLRSRTAPRGRFLLLTNALDAASYNGLRES